MKLSRLLMSQEKKLPTLGQKVASRVRGVLADVALHRKVPGTRTSTAALSSAARQRRALELSRREQQQQVVVEEAALPQPAVARDWVRAPPSPFATVANRKEWFRLMHFNFMVDSRTKHRLHWVNGGREFVTTPITAIDVRVPDGDDGSFLDPVASRIPRLVEELQFHDPDVVTLNEVNELLFTSAAWKRVRALGYGAMFTSNRRGRKIPAGEDPTKHSRYQGAMPVEENVGNVVLYHKARFFPVVQPSCDVVESPECLVTVLRDKVSNLSLMLANAHLTPGATLPAIRRRAEEAQLVKKAIFMVKRKVMDKPFCATVVCGDMCNVHDEEPCLAEFRDGMASAYDVVGGPRWTTWHWLPEREATAEASSGVKRLAEGEGGRAGDSSSSGGNSGETAPPTSASSIATTQEPATDLADPLPELTVEELFPEGAAAAADLMKLPSVVATRRGQAEKERRDALANINAITRSLRPREVKRTSDFMFFEDSRLSVLQVLDVPNEDLIDRQTLLPSRDNPSHHVSLVADFCFNSWLYSSDVDH